MTDSIALRKAWEEHPRYRYRGCAPDPDDPRRAAGNLDLTLDDWSGSDRDGGEPQKEREARQAAAVDVCFGCAVMVQCDAYASSVVWVNGVPRVAEPEGVWGGRTALERHRMLIRSCPETKAAPDRRFQTVQKQAVLRALAGCWDPFEVAAAAGMDVRTANWQRSSLVRLLGLPKDVTRMRALAVARERGLLEGVDVVEDDGSVPAVPPPTPTKAPARVEPTQLVLWDRDGQVDEPDTVRPPVRVRRRSRAGRVVSGLTLDDALTPAASVQSVFPSHVALEAAA